MFTKLQRRILVVAGGLAVGYAVAFDGIHNRLLPPKPAAAISFTSRGPFSGRKIGECWIAGEPKSHFSANDVVVWQLHADPKLDVTAIVGTELWCSGHPVQFEESRVAAEQVATGWNSFGIMIPRDATGECHLQRHVQTQDENGAAVQDYELRRPIGLVVDP